MNPINSMNTWMKKVKNFFRFNNKSQNKSIDLIELNQEDYAPWWGNFSVSSEQSRYIKIGSIIICIDHYNAEWQIVCQQEQESNIPTQTFSIKSQTDEITLKPCLLQRPLMVYLPRTIFIPPGSDLTVYIISPALIQMAIGKTPENLLEIPTAILSDTWYGSPLMGELCFAGQNAALKIEDIDLNNANTNIITPVTIVNRGHETITMQEIKIPLPNLSVYQDNQNHLWTEQVVVAHQNDLTSTIILKNSGDSLKNLTLLCHARLNAKKRFKGLFGYFGSKP